MLINKKVLLFKKWHLVIDQETKYSWGMVSFRIAFAIEKQQPSAGTLHWNSCSLVNCHVTDLCNMTKYDDRGIFWHVEQVWDMNMAWVMGVSIKGVSRQKHWQNHELAEKTTIFKLTVEGVQYD